MQERAVRASDSTCALSVTNSFGEGAALTHATQSMLSSAPHFRRIHALDIILAIMKAEAKICGMKLPAKMAPVLFSVATWHGSSQCIDSYLEGSKVIHTAGSNQ